MRLSIAVLVLVVSGALPFRAKVGQMWTVLYFNPAAQGKTSLRIVAMGFGSDAESQGMKEFFERGNAYTLDELQKHFSN